jgi:hypothetical protein
MTSIRRRVSSPVTLYRLIYRSRNDIPEVDIGREIRSILASSRRNNMANNVTGALLFTASGFAQVLEGPRDVVELTFERIGADPRHADVMVLSFTPTERRCFSQWSMAFCGQTSSSDPLAEEDGGMPQLAGLHAASGSDVLRLFEKVIQREEEWIAA